MAEQARISALSKRTKRFCFLFMSENWEERKKIVQHIEMRVIVILRVFAIDRNAWIHSYSDRVICFSAMKYFTI